MGYQKYIYIFIFLVLITIYYFPLIILKGTFSGVDISLLNIPSNAYAFNTIKEGYIPLWTNLIHLGFPILAEGHIALFYPFNILYLFGDWEIANYLFLIHIFLAVYFFYLFLIELRINFIVSFLSSILFLLFMISFFHANSMNELYCFTYIPLILVFVNRWIERKKIIYIVLSSIILSFQLFSGFPQITFYTILYIFIYISSRSIIYKDRRDIIFKNIVAIIIIIIVGVIFSLGQVLPTLELFSLSTRAKGIILQDVGFVQLPGGAGNLLLSILSLAFILILLIVSYIFKIDEKFKIFLYLSFIFWFLSLPFVYEKLHLIPLFNFFRFHSKIIYLFIFSLIVTVGYFLSFIINLIKSSTLKKSILFLLLIPSILSIIFKERIEFIDPKYFKEPNFIKTIKKDKSIWRCGILNLSGNLFWGNLNMLYKVEQLSGYTPLRTKRRYEIGKVLTPHMFSLLGGKYLLTDVDMRMQKYKLIYNRKVEFPLFKNVVHGSRAKFYNIRIYENKNYISRIFSTNKIKIIKNEQDIIKEIMNENFSPYHYAILEEKIDKYLPSSPVNSSFKFIEYKPNKICISATTDNPCFVVLNQAFYPGWRLYINGKKEKLYPANYIMQGFFLNKGTHKIKLIYVPFSFYLGIIISGISFLAVVFLIYRKK